MFILISLAGLPPIIGFMGKVCVIKSTIILISLLFTVFLLFRSLIIIFLYIGFSYLSICYSPYTLPTPKKKKFSIKDNIYITSVIMV